MSLSVVLRNATVGISLLAGALLLACGDSGAPGKEPPTAEKPAPLPPDHPATSPPQPAPPPPEPAAEAGDPVARGAEHYQLYCASCHGAEGGGDGPLAAALDPKPAAHNDGAYMNALTDEYLTRVIKEGGAAVGKSPLMAPWGGALNDAQLKDVVAFIRSLADPPYPGS